MTLKKTDAKSQLKSNLGQKIAITVFNDRISARFDCFHRMIILTYDPPSQQYQRQELTIMDMSPYEKINLLEELNIDTLICGGMLPICDGYLALKGVKTISWITGNAEEVIQLYLDGKLTPTQGRGNTRGKNE